MARPRESEAIPAPRQRVQPLQERSRRKIELILDATAQLLAEQGVEAASTTAIAQRAGVPPATVYHYFENRLAVFVALAERTMASVDERLTRTLTEIAQSAHPDWRQVLATLYAAYRDAPGYVAVLRALRAEPAAQEVMRASNERMAAVIAEVLTAHTRLPSGRARRVAWIISGICEQVLQQALLSQDEAEDWMDEVAEMLDVLLRHYAAD